MCVLNASGCWENQCCLHVCLDDTILPWYRSQWPRETLSRTWTQPHTKIKSDFKNWEFIYLNATQSSQTVHEHFHTTTPTHLDLLVVVWFGHLSTKQTYILPQHDSVVTDRTWTRTHDTITFGCLIDIPAVLCICCDDIITHTYIFICSFGVTYGLQISNMHYLTELRVGDTYRFWRNQVWPKIEYIDIAMCKNHTEVS